MLLRTQLLYNLPLIIRDTSLLVSSGTNKDVSLIMIGRLYSSCVRSSMLHGSETWPVRKENVVAL